LAAMETPEISVLMVLQGDTEPGIDLCMCALSQQRCYAHDMDRLYEWNRSVGAYEPLGGHLRFRGSRLGDRNQGRLMERVGCR
jgi:hypothetical protein